MIFVLKTIKLRTEECPGCIVLDSCLDMEDKINSTGELAKAFISLNSTNKDR